MAALEALERELRTLVRRSQSQGSMFAALVHPELDSSAFPLLAYIESHPGSRGSDLAAHFHVGRATISRQLTRLEDLGLIERFMDPDDSRGQLISLTAYGRTQVQSAANARVQALAEVVANWNETDVHMLAELLGRYLRDYTRWRGRHPEAAITATPPNQ
jgi:DNA-binding MarR family transcriptional regulator